MEGGFPSIRSEWPQILQMIKSDDEMLVYQGAMELRDALAYAQENQMHGFQTEQYLDTLVKIVNREIITDLSNEVKFFSIQCLSTLMDIFPGSVNNLVHVGLVKGMSTVLQNSFGFIDLSEACIKAFEKIVLENPPAVLRSGAIGIILQQMDFFEQSIQQRIFRIILKISRHSSNENDFDTHLVPILPFLIANLDCNLIQTEQKKLEDVSKIIYEMQESFLHFFSPHHEMKKIGQQYEKLLDYGIYDIYIEHIKLFAKQYSKISNEQQEEAKYNENIIKNNNNIEINESKQIDSYKQGANTVSNLFITNALKLFENSCKFSNKISNKIFSDQVLITNLSKFLPNTNVIRQYNPENFPFINEVVNLFNALFSEKDFISDEKILNKTENELERQEFEEKIASSFLNHLKIKQDFENEKIKFQIDSKNRGIIQSIAKIILPRIFFVYETVINQNIKIKSLQLIKKILALFDDELLRNSIEPKQFANFISQIIKSKHLSSIEVCLKITKKVLDSSPFTYVVPFIREGVSFLIDGISSDQKFKIQMGIKQEVDILDSNFDFDIFNVKEALNHVRTNHPEDYQKKEYYERKLLELVEKQKYHEASEKDTLKEKILSASNRQKVAIQQKKMELSNKLQSQFLENKILKQELVQNESQEFGKSKNILPQIFQQCQLILQKYFQNQQFMEELQNDSERSKIQLSIQDQLLTISSDLCFEATQYHQNLQQSCIKVKQLLTKIANLISSEDGITSHEFRNSNLLFALELFLTKTPQQAKDILNNQKNIQIEECKVQEEQSEKNIAGICMINRLKLFIHVFINKQNQKSSIIPIQALIELNHKLISENDSIFTKISSSQIKGFNDYNQYQLGHPSIFGVGADYDHFINSLKQLQKRITINLIYDPLKQKINEIKNEILNTENIEIKFQERTLSNREDSVMKYSDDEQQSEIQENQSHISKQQEVIKFDQNETNENLINLAGSPNKAIKKQKKIDENASSVYLKRNYLYSQLNQIPVTVEQTSCLQILEDFLRNRIKNDDEVKQLKIDTSSYSHYGRNDLQRQGEEFSFNQNNIFEQAINSQQYQSVTQKMLRKNLQNGARKILDSSNQRLAKILNSEFLFQSLQKKDKKPKQQKLKNKIKPPESDQKETVKSQADRTEKNKSGQSSSESNIFMEEEDSSECSEDYDYGDEMMNDLEEKEEDEDVHRQSMLQVFIDEVANEIINSQLPEEQQIMLAKIMTRQHTFMLNYMEMNMAERENKIASGQYDMGEGNYDEEMQQLESKIDDFQQTMEQVYDKFMSLKSLQRQSSENQSKNLKNDSQSIIQNEHKNKSKKLNKKFKNFIQKINNIVENDSSDNQDMKDEEENFKQRILAKKIQRENEIAFQLKSGSGENSDDVLDISSNESFLFFQQKYFKNKTLDEIQKQSLSKESSTLLKSKDQKLEIEHQKSFIEQQINQEQIKADVEKNIDKKIQNKILKNQLFLEENKEILNKDLDELIKIDGGNDVEFEFFYEGQLINQNQSIFEIIKDSLLKRKSVQQQQLEQEHQRIQKEKEEWLKNKSQEVQETKKEKLSQLKKEGDKIKEIFSQMDREINPRSMFQRGQAPPSSFLQSISNAHKIFFRIKDKTDEVAKLQRNRFDSIIELTKNNGQRIRTQSKAVQDLSNSSIDYFVYSILNNDFKVFENVANDILQDLNNQEQEINLLEKSLKILKVVNFIYSNLNLFSEKGMKFIGKEQTENHLSDIDFSDFTLQSNFSKIRPSVFHHQKLDSYLQRSIKDPYNLVQGISPILRQLTINCPFLFPFATKQLYFKLVSFISSIDVQRSIYYLRQYMKQQSGNFQVGANNRNTSHEKDNLKKISKQKVKIQRDKLIQSAFQIIQKIEKRSFLEFEFEGEEGTGLGPTLEFYDNIAEDFKNWSIDFGNSYQFKMWKTTQENLLFPTPLGIQNLDKKQIQQVYEIFRLCGIIVAKAIVDDRQIDLPISSLFWKLCMGKQLSIFDIQQLDQTVFQFLQDFQIISNQTQSIKQDNSIKEEQKNILLSKLTTITNNVKIEDFGLFFNYPGYDNIELIPNGGQIEVNLENVQDYIDLVLDYTFLQTIKVQIQAFKKGFNSIFPINSLIPFIHSSCPEDELETMICGIKCKDEEWQNKEELMKYIQPDHGYTKKSDQYLFFIRYITELVPLNRQQFLKFLTGSKRLPIGGFKSLQPNLTLVLKKENAGQKPDQILPSVMACQNYVKSPTYSSYEVFKQRFDFAVKEGQQNFALS